MRTKNRILLESKVWAQEKVSGSPGYFKELSVLHDPNLLWLASSDSLVPVQELINAEPGAVLVYSNIGVQVRADDKSLMAIVEEAVAVHRIKHIVVCGYSNCGGIRDVIQGKDDLPAAKEWLKDLRKLYEAHAAEMSDFTPEQKEKFLNELNIRQQVINLSNLPVIQNAWLKSDYPRIFGWYFDLLTGTLREVFSMENNHRIEQVSTLLDAIET